ncbi:short-chain dehydrogenase [Mycobacterium florentinum]|uniref:3-oxoacyl-[acyl-carrier-protein] reductase MabA n=1 Tax=Mycobacterium florentinum TaxID=292462 RepID=A0A1X1UAM9_MYCFL|nr:SDR family NAD(P)-dependent oxidoreductase [Mycobacterium florentinum]MCV7408074.1 SDR family oxidoreductase [Mycobacterium florentinum]ORV53892.1 short-chain dehydrogenase [Mycobacterium florentinum]BBX77291.1 3-oxoacyl-[acyl-carrier-protein] reductase FabG [Mycobacterium florentinum]
MSSTALVTGAARGIGRSVADTLESKGIRVLRPGRQELDLARSESVSAYLSGLDETVDILVLNAGINNPEPLQDISAENWSGTQQVNVSANLQLLQGLLPRMAAAGYGRVVALSSVYAHRARAGRVAYSSSKAAIEEVVRSVAVEYGPFGVIANCVAPGFVLTDLTYQNNDAKQLDALAARIPIGRLAEPVEIARFISWLVSAENSYITGQSIAIDGGFLCL